MKPNTTFFKLKVVNDFLKATSEARNTLLEECIGQGGTDPVVRMRRFRMLSQLSQFEADTIKKIYNFDSDNDVDNLTQGLKLLLDEVKAVTNRSA
jgi:hypothetical protein